MVQIYIGIYDRIIAKYKILLIIFKKKAIVYIYVTNGKIPPQNPYPPFFKVFQKSPISFKNEPK